MRYDIGSYIERFAHLVRIIGEMDSHLLAALIGGSPRLIAQSLLIQLMIFPDADTDAAFRTGGKRAVNLLDDIFCSSVKVPGIRKNHEMVHIPV